MQIAPVLDNWDKYLTYRQWSGRYKKAMGDGFYFEALLIDYALVEDAMRSYLYHIGVIAERNSKRACKKANPLRGLIEAYLPKEKTDLSISNISGKMKIVRATLLWHLDDMKALPDDPYLKALNKQYSERIDAAEFLNLLKCVDTWRDYRNEIMHALMNKNLAAVDEHLAEKCEEGMTLVRELQAQVKRVKYRNRIRRSMKLPVR